MRANPTLQVVDLIRLDAKFLYAAEQRNFTADKGIVAEFVCRRISRDPASQGSTRVLKFWAFAGSGGDYSMADQLSRIRYAAEHLALHLDHLNGRTSN